MDMKRVSSCGKNNMKMYSSLAIPALLVSLAHKCKHTQVNPRLLPLWGLSTKAEKNKSSFFAKTPQ